MDLNSHYNNNNTNIAYLTLLLLIRVIVFRFDTDWARIVDTICTKVAMQ